MSGKYVVGLDIGTTKVCAVIGRYNAGGGEVVACGVSPSYGMKKGVIVDIDAASESIKKAVADAESASGIDIRSAYVGIAGSHMKCIDSFGAAGIKGKEVSRRDVERVIDSASSVYVPLDRDVLHVLPSDYIIDGQDGIRQPVGMSGVRLEAKVNIVTVSHPIVDNLIKCCEKAGVKAVQIVLEPIAAARAVLSEDEMESGVVLIDIGGGTTSMAVYRDKRLRHTSVIPMAGSHMTNDIAVGLRLSQKEAERVKREYGCVLPDLIAANEQMEVTGINGQQNKVPRRCIAEILMPRCMELFELVRAEIKDTLLYSVVLTGGASTLEGMDKVIEAVIGLPVRGGAAPGVIGAASPGVMGAVPPAIGSVTLTPSLATGIGLMLYGIDREFQDSMQEDILNRVSGWFKGWNIPWIKQPVRVL